MVVDPASVKSRGRGSNHRSAAAVCDHVRIMAGRRFLWALALPLAAVGWLAGHSLAYTLVVPQDAHREELLAETGHAYLPGMPHVASCALTILLAGLVLAAYEGMRGNARARLPVWPLVLLPPLGFAAQEYM